MINAVGRYFDRGITGGPIRRRQRTRPGRGRTAQFEFLEQRQLLAIGAQVLDNVNPPITFQVGSHFVSAGPTTLFQGFDPLHGFELWKTDGTNAGTVLVKDIDSGTNSAYPRDFVNVGGTLYFIASDGISTGLWKSNGTSVGTTLVADINPPETDNWNHYGADLTNVNGTLYFVASDGTHGYELWKSNGTSAGTNMVKDIFPGATGSSPHSLTNLSGVLYFLASDATGHPELWKSDGSSFGTSLVKDFQSSGATYNEYLTNVAGQLFLSVGNSSQLPGLWRSDGTSGGTVLVHSLVRSVADPAITFFNIGSTVYFEASDGTNGFELWRSDGTSGGTFMVKDINAGSQNSYPRDFVNLGGTLYFRANDGTHGDELWKSDGTSSGTMMVDDINAGSGGSGPPSFYQNMGITNFGGTLYFSANDGTHGTELWKSNGTSSGTSLVTDIVPGSKGSTPDLISNVGGTLYLMLSQDNTPGSSYSFWKSDGSSSGTVLVRDNVDAQSNPKYFTAVGGMAFFSANDGTHGYELWKTNGTSSGTALVKDINPGSGDSRPGQFVNVAGTLFFWANDGTTGLELWRSDGTSSGTTLVKDIDPGSNGSGPEVLTNVNGTLYFIANDGSHGTELWKSDGTSSGTVLVRDIRLGPAGAYPTDLTNVAGTLLFTANDGANGFELWRSDGTSGGTVLIKDIYPGGTASNPGFFTVAGSALYFLATDPTHGTELWRSDGTSSGTTVFDINPGPNSSYISDLANVSGTLYFGGTDGTNGYGIWKTDGTSSGTSMVKELYTGNPIIESLTNVSGTLYFTAYDPTHGEALWSINGASNSAMALPGGNQATKLTNIGGLLYFNYNDGTHGPELWRSDGTIAGTVLDDINPGTVGSGPASLTNFNGALLFAANDGSTGIEPWIVGPDTAPTTSGISQLNFIENGAPTVLTLTNYFSDAEQTPQTLVYSIQSDTNPALFTSVAINSSNSTLTLTYAPGALGTAAITVRATDAGGLFVNTTVAVTDAPPTATISGPAAVVLLNPTTFTLTATDVTPADQAGNFAYLINWGDGSAPQTVIGPTGSQVTHAFTTAGALSISVTATDQDHATGPASDTSVTAVTYMLLPDAANHSLQDLVWGGSGGSDQPHFIQTGPTTVEISTPAAGQVFAPVTIQTVTGVTGSVIIRGGAGNDTLDASQLTTIPAILDGGGGNNTLVGGGGGETLIGGSNGGEGQQGSNVIIAGNGNNTIYGNAPVGAEGSTGGNNIIIGGSGNDTIYGTYGSVVKSNGQPSNGGEGGHNIIVGGGGSDTIYASQQANGAEGGHGSILIAGSTSLNSAALTAVMNEWTSSDSLATKIADISGTGSGGANGTNYLQAGVTVFNDGAVDQLYSDANGLADWFLYTSGQDGTNRTKVSDILTNVP